MKSQNFDKLLQFHDKNLFTFVSLLVMVLFEILEMNKIFFVLLILNFAFNSIVHSYQTNNGKKIVIIGAGASGLCAARRAISKGFDVTVFEQTEHIGGTWVYTDRTGYDDYGQLSFGTVYKSLL